MQRNRQNVAPEGHRCTGVVEARHKGELEERRVTLDQHGVRKMFLYHQGVHLG